MGHHITALILKGDFDTAKAEYFDLYPVSLGFGLTLFHIDHYYSAYWQYKLQTTGDLETVPAVRSIFPKQMAIAEIMKAVCLSSPCAYAIIQTDYFGGVGNQYAQVFHETTNVDTRIQTINQALNYLGVVATPGMDAFDTVGLGVIRSQPAFLDKYADLTEEYDL